MHPVGQGSERGVQEEGLHHQSPSFGGKGTPSPWAPRWQGAGIPGTFWVSES